MPLPPTGGVFKKDKKAKGVKSEDKKDSEGNPALSKFVEAFSSITTLLTARFTGTCSSPLLI